MSLPLISELGINTFDRARRNVKQRLQPSLLQQRSNKIASSRQFSSNRSPI